MNLKVLIVVIIFLAGCAKQHVNTPGDYHGSLTVDGLIRTYTVHIPVMYDESTPAPLIIALHGGGGSAEKMANLTNFNALSDTEGFIVVYPNGVENHWNDGREVQNYRAHREDVDDVKFIAALIDHVSEALFIDETRIYVTGISNGAMMSCRLACELSEKIAAIAMVAGAMPEALSVHCSPFPVPVLIMNGTDDPLVTWEGGEIRVGRQSLGVILSVHDTVMYWVTVNKCSSSPEITWLPDTKEDGCTVRREVYGKGKNGTDVVLYAIEGGGHTWPGGPQYASERLIGRTCYDIDAAEIIWQFFTGYTR